MNDKKKVLVFTASYNEKDNIEKLILEINKFLPEAFILIIDDNSPDQTSDIVEKLKTKKDVVFPIHLFSLFTFRFEIH